MVAKTVVSWGDTAKDEAPSPYSRVLGYDPEKRTYHICYWDRKQNGFVVPGLGSNGVRFWVQLPEPPTESE